jgi:hypothetical protein
MCRCLTVILDPNFAMMRPHLVADIDLQLRKKIAAHIVTNYSGGTALTPARMARYLPSRMDEYKKIKILDQEELVRVAGLLDGAEKIGRDNSFIKVSC